MLENNYLIVSSTFEKKKLNLMHFMFYNRTVLFAFMYLCVRARACEREREKNCKIEKLYFHNPKYHYK